MQRRGLFPPDRWVPVCDNRSADTPGKIGNAGFNGFR
jgi:hypothetical protein